MPTNALLINTPTATDPATVRASIVPAPLNFAADWRIAAEKPGEVTLTNIKIDRATPETIRIAAAEIANVFKGTPLTPLPAQAVKGSSILLQLNAVGASTADSGDIFYYPFSAHLVLKVPHGMSVTSEDIDMMLVHLLGAMSETGEAANDNRVDGLLRGVVKPIDL